MLLPLVLLPGGPRLNGADRSRAGRDLLLRLAARPRVAFAPGTWGLVPGRNCGGLLLVFLRLGRPECGSVAGGQLGAARHCFHSVADD